jgi:hypothetical protein
MKVSTERRAMARVLAGLLKERKEPHLTVATRSGESFPLYEPITVAPDFLMGHTAESPKSSPTALVPFAAIESIRLDRE